MRPMMLDMDPGIDDALALVAALGCFVVSGVTTVAGNTSGDHTYHNARVILARAGRTDIPVTAGSDEPLFVPLYRAENIHGHDGLAGQGGPVTVPPQGENSGWGWIAERLAQGLGQELIATGPLTNIARLMLGFPRLADRLETLVIMGGARYDGNVTPTAEFNFYVDPYAADWVLAHGHGIRLVGLDVARGTRQPIEEFRPLLDMGSLGLFLWELLCPYAKATTHHGNPPSVVLYDVLAVAAMDCPELFQWTEASLAVVHEGPLRGTLIEMKPQQRRPAVAVATDVDTPAFYEWFWSALQQATRFVSA